MIPRIIWLTKNLGAGLAEAAETADKPCHEDTKGTKF